MGSFINKDIIKLVNQTENADVFFSILPLDWEESIEPIWNSYKNNTKIFTLEHNKETVAGGMVFSTVSPDVMEYKPLAESWFNKGYLYLAYIYVNEKYRENGLGSLWLNLVFKEYNNQKFWLTIEDYNLTKFYEKSGFKLIQEIQLENSKEWLMTKR